MMEFKSNYIILKTETDKLNRTNITF